MVEIVVLKILRIIAITKNGQFLQSQFLNKDRTIVTDGTVSFFVPAKDKRILVQYGK